jgi:hypothetical protein
MNSTDERSPVNARALPPDSPNTSDCDCASDSAGIVRAISILTLSVPVEELLNEKSLTLYGYLPLSYVAMQTVGEATQTLGAIRSHWGRGTWANPATIAAAAFLAESTVRRRHLPKLLEIGYLIVRKVRGSKGWRNEYVFNSEKLLRPWFDGKRATLPRWAAAMLPEWSYRAIYATILQRCRATALGSNDRLTMRDVAFGGYGRHNWSLSKLSKLTGLNRASVVRAKEFLISNGWIESGGKDRRGELLFVAPSKQIPHAVLRRVHETTRGMMFKKKS